MLVATLLLATLVQTAGSSPYVGEEGRSVKALSADEMRALEAGEGMGLAKAAELNHYPGPRHVLDLADMLGLSQEQRAAIQASFVRMQAAARGLGSELVDRERDLDAAFARATIDAAGLERLALEIGTLQGRLRAVHLRAHLETRAVLSAPQVEHYDRLRGYGDGRGHEHHSRD
jgi:Spy/CpxP family protein refolding chaperone